MKILGLLTCYYFVVVYVSIYCYEQKITAVESMLGFVL